MFPDDVVKRLNSLIQPAFEARDALVRQGIIGQQNIFAASGRAGSGSELQAAMEIAVEDLPVRANMAWAELQRVAEVNPAHATDAKELLAAIVQANSSSLQEMVSRLPAVVKEARYATLAKERFCEAERQTKERLYAEIDVHVAGLRGRDRMQNSGGNTINNYGTVRNMQIGNNNVAHSTQHIDASVKIHIHQVLEQVQQDIEQVSDEVLPAKAELVDMVTRCKEEAAKEVPNKTLLRSMLNGLATTISTVSDLQGTWEAIKNVLTLWN